MSKLSELRPTERKRVIDLVEAAGINVSDWGNFKKGKKYASVNPKYCYEWSFVEAHEVVVLNLWYEEIRQLRGHITFASNLREDAKRYLRVHHKGVWAKRAMNMDRAIQVAANDELPIRVIVLSGSMRDRSNPKADASNVTTRMLDPLPWTVTRYDQKTGECTLTRAATLIDKKSTITNPDWTRDELILALNLYLKSRPNPPGKESDEIKVLSEILSRLGGRLFPASERSATFRNRNGLYMKLMNFRRLDPEYTASGKKGLSAGAKGEEEVWKEFANDPKRCEKVANAIIESVDDPEGGLPFGEPDIDDFIQEAPEGRLLTRKHIARERNRKLIDSKKKQAMREHGKLACEVCQFDFATQYGKRGDGFIECHHTKAVATLAEGHRTHLNDLVLLCANCHRIIHRTKPWLTVEELVDVMQTRNEDNGAIT